jgi:hypothetical protein
MELEFSLSFYKIFSGNKACQLWIKAQRFGEHLRLHHQGNDVKVDHWWCLYTWSNFSLERPLANVEYQPTKKPTKGGV